MYSSMLLACETAPSGVRQSAIFLTTRSRRFLVIRFFTMKTILLLICSNAFMTAAWYGHLKYRQTPLVLAILASWAIALAEYCFQVPANRIGYGEFTLFQLKIIQEVITLSVFVVFAWLYFGDSIKWNHGVSFMFLVGAVVFAFMGKA